MVLLAWLYVLRRFNLITNFRLIQILILTFFNFSFYYKFRFYDLQKNESQQPVMLDSLFFSVINGCWLHFFYFYGQLNRKRYDMPSFSKKIYTRIKCFQLIFCVYSLEIHKKIGLQFFLKKRVDSFNVGKTKFLYDSTPVFLLSRVEPALNSSENLSGTLYSYCSNI